MIVFRFIEEVFFGAIFEGLYLLCVWFMVLSDITFGFVIRQTSCKVIIRRSVRNYFQAAVGNHIVTVS
jgi:hypothetical protein